MKLSTRIEIKPFKNQINYNSKVMLLGSCFATNIGDKFDYYKFQSSTNPFGIIFNPISLDRIIERTINKEYFTKEAIFFHNEQWHSFEVHSEMSSIDSEQFILNLNSIINATNQFLENASHVIITLGTAWVYRLKDTNQVVANCHKVAQNQFSKALLSIIEIEESLHKIIKSIHDFNPNCNVIFTVSPVRHLKDGFIENQQSKAHLISALHQIIEQYDDFVTYFPSYEILLDELRDYRFYAEDMLHPNQLAVNYIWERFCEATISKENQSIMNEVSQIQKAKAHRPFNPKSESYLKLNQELDLKIKKLTDEYVFMKF